MDSGVAETHRGRRLAVQVSTLLVITLAVLAARHLPFATPALLVAAATFARTLNKGTEIGVNAFLTQSSTLGTTGLVYWIKAVLGESWCAFFLVY